MIMPDIIMSDKNNNKLHIEKMLINRVRINLMVILYIVSMTLTKGKTVSSQKIPHHAHSVFGYGYSYLVDALFERF